MFVSGIQFLCHEFRTQPRHTDGFSENFGVTFAYRGAPSGGYEPASFLMHAPVQVSQVLKFRKGLIHFQQIQKRTEESVIQDSQGCSKQSGC